VAFKLTQSKFGACRKCMVLSSILAPLSIVVLFLSFRFRLDYLVLLSSVATGSFVTLFLLHITAYALRRTSKTPASQSNNRDCYDQ
jgi:hypothetical protein